MDPAMNLTGLLVGFPKFHALSKEYEQYGQPSKDLYMQAALNSIIKCNQKSCRVNASEFMR